jgi:hypothetical protein
MSECLVVVAMSLIYRIKKVVDRVLPCGIPCVMSCGFDVALSVCNVCVLLVKYDVRNDIVWGSKLNMC